MIVNNVETFFFSSSIAPYPSYLDDETTGSPTWTSPTTQPQPNLPPTTPKGTLWAEPAPYPSYLDNTTGSPSWCTPTTTPTHHPNNNPSAANEHKDAERSPSAHTPSDLDTPPPLLPRSTPDRRTRLPIWRRYGKWRSPKSSTTTPSGQTTPLPPLLSTPPRPLSLPLPLKTLNLSPMPLLPSPNSLNQTLLTLLIV